MSELTPCISGSNTELKSYKNDEEFLSELEDAISDIIQDGCPMDKSKLIEMAKNIDIFIEGFL